jgi:hypothetical protein
MEIERSCVLNKLVPGLLGKMLYAYLKADSD